MNKAIEHTLRSEQRNIFLFCRIPLYIWDPNLRNGVMHFYPAFNGRILPGVGLLSKGPMGYVVLYRAEWFIAKRD